MLFILVVIIAVLVFVFMSISPSISEVANEEKPPIIDHFACGDNCPGPPEKYMVKIYQGVEDEEECLRLGGHPSSYTGWGTVNICIVK